MEQIPNSDIGGHRTLKHFECETSEAEKSFGRAARNVIEKHAEHALVVHQADWHLRGVLHHTRNVLATYTEFADEIASRASIDPLPDVIIMYAPSFQTMMFEFYALVNLSRITLDNIRLFLRPVFKTDFGQLPKSVNKFLQGKTDCPAYLDLADNPVLQYLSDLRNCIVHFRTFATSDNAVVVGDHVGQDEQEKLLSGNEWFDPMAKAHFRWVGDDVSVNVLLPDRIFDHSGSTEKMVKFTYVERYNLLSQSMNFMRLICYAIGKVYSLLIDPGKPTFVFSKS
ncbi:hypothetical protein ACFL3Q_14975 [Planctomycetota bacterium]